MTNEVWDQRRTEEIIAAKLAGGPAKMDTGREPKAVIPPEPESEPELESESDEESESKKTRGKRAGDVRSSL